MCKRECDYENMCVCACVYMQHDTTEIKTVAHYDENKWNKINQDNTAAESVVKSCFCWIKKQIVAKNREKTMSEQRIVWNGIYEWCEQKWKKEGKKLREKGIIETPTANASGEKESGFILALIYNTLCKYVTAVIWTKFKHVCELVPVYVPCVRVCVCHCWCCGSLCCCFFNMSVLLVDTSFCKAWIWYV